MWWSWLAVVICILVIAFVTYVLEKMLDKAFIDGMERGIGIGYKLCYKENFSEVDNIKLEDDGK